jgi:hypothetical protein
MGANHAIRTLSLYLFAAVADELVCLTSTPTSDQASNSLVSRHRRSPPGVTESSAASSFHGPGRARVFDQPSRERRRRASAKDKAFVDSNVNGLSGIMGRAGMLQSLHEALGRIVYLEQFARRCSPA